MRWLLNKLKHWWKPKEVYTPPLIGGAIVPMTTVVIRDNEGYVLLSPNDWIIPSNTDVANEMHTVNLMTAAYYDWVDNYNSINLLKQPYDIDKPKKKIKRNLPDWF